MTRSPVVAAAGAVVGAGAAALAYARFVESSWFALRHLTVPLLVPGTRPVTVLHLSDLHLLPAQRRKRAFVRSLAALEPDLVVDTGDNIASADAVDALLEDLTPLLERPGAFVLGSNDRYAPARKNPLRYLLPDPREGMELPATDLPTGRMVEAMRAAGWKDLSNRRDRVAAGGLRIELVGTDDAHLDRDEPLAPRTAAETDLHLGVTHAPYARVLDAFAADGTDLLLAGHTHGGQVCLPGGRALVTNCDLHPSRARGLSSWRGVPLHVSGGIGTSPYQQIRFACRPEATLLTLVAGT